MRLPLGSEPAAAAGLPLLPELLGIRRAGAGAPWCLARRMARRSAPVQVRPVACGRLRPCTLSMDTQRLILLFIFGFSVLMLWEAWDREQRPKPPAVQAAQPAVPAPAPAKTPSAAPPPGQIAPSAPAEAAGEVVRITTDLIIAEIDTRGGTLKRLELLRHKDSNDPEKSFVLIGPAHQYEAQSGLAGEGGPNHRSLWRAEPGPRALAAGAESVELRLTAQGKDGLEVEKTFTFKRNSYVIDVTLQLRNGGGAPLTTYAYFQLTHDGKPEGNRNTVAETFGAQSFTGFAVYSDEHKFEKVHP